MVNDVLQLVLWTLIPGLELRASIPYGILVLGMGWISVFLICLVVNALLGPIVYLALTWFVEIFRKVKWIDKLYQKAVVRTQKKVHKHVERYGVWGLAVFIGIPLPGSGSYTGALAAYVLGLDLKRFVVANLIGVLIAGVVVTVVTLTGSQVFHMFIKVIQ